MNETKLYRVRHDGRDYTLELTEAEREVLIRRYHGYISVEPVSREPAFDYDVLAQEIADYRSV